MGSSVLRFPPVSPVRITPRGAFRFDRTSYRGLGEDGKRAIHAGVDLGAPGGTHVIAPAFGRVIEVVRESRPPWRGYAPIVLFKSDDGMYHLLSHLANDRHLPTPGDVLPGGARIGTVSPKYRHVHWEVRPIAKPGETGWPHTKRPFEVTIDPMAWLAEGVPDSDHPFFETLAGTEDDPDP